jgi:hypothetical protein
LADGSNSGGYFSDSKSAYDSQRFLRIMKINSAVSKHYRAGCMPEPICETQAADILKNTIARKEILADF